MVSDRALYGSALKLLTDPVTSPRCIPITGTHMLPSACNPHPRPRATPTPPPPPPPPPPLAPPLLLLPPVQSISPFPSPPRTPFTFAFAPCFIPYSRTPTRHQPHPPLRPFLAGHPMSQPLCLPPLHIPSLPAFHPAPLPIHPPPPNPPSHSPISPHPLSHLLRSPQPILPFLPFSPTSPPISPFPLNPSSHFHVPSLHATRASPAPPQPHMPSLPSSHPPSHRLPAGLQAPRGSSTPSACCSPTRARWRSPIGSTPSPPASCAPGGSCHWAGPNLGARGVKGEGRGLPRREEGKGRMGVWHLDVCHGDLPACRLSQPSYLWLSTVTCSYLCAIVSCVAPLHCSPQPHCMLFTFSHHLLSRLSFCLPCFPSPSPPQPTVPFATRLYCLASRHNAPSHPCPFFSRDLLSPSSSPLMVALQQRIKAHLQAYLGDHQRWKQHTASVISFAPTPLTLFSPPCALACRRIKAHMQSYLRDHQRWKQHAAAVIPFASIVPPGSPSELLCLSHLAALLGFTTVGGAAQGAAQGVAQGAAEGFGLDASQSSEGGRRAGAVDVRAVSKALAQLPVPTGWAPDLVMKLWPRHKSKGGSERGLTREERSELQQFVESLALPATTASKE
ncbi:unnamed protein product [Closterium sp. Naga37s-1]|nr:unnamed protein product [Closterium sp. Naga37s-1]